MLIAGRVARYIRERDNETVTPYLCPNGLHYHIGHNPAAYARIQDINYRNRMGIANGKIYSEFAGLAQKN